MYTKAQLFRILYALVVEEDVSLLAQDAYPACAFALEHLAGLQEAIESAVGLKSRSRSQGDDEPLDGEKAPEELERQREETPEEARGREAIKRLCDEASELLAEKEEWVLCFRELQTQARVFWATAPVDQNKVDGATRTTIERWRRLFADNDTDKGDSTSTTSSSSGDSSSSSSAVGSASHTGATGRADTADALGEDVLPPPLPPPDGGVSPDTQAAPVTDEDIPEHVEAFRQACRAVIDRRLSELQDQLAREDSAHERIIQECADAHAKIRDETPPYCVWDPLVHGGDWVVSGADATVQHYTLASPGFTHMLGYSRARIFAASLLHPIINTQATNKVVAKLLDNANPGVAIVVYRAASLKTKAIRWTVTIRPDTQSPMGIGVNITHLVRNARISSASRVQDMLRQWLHSIRNASFKQQVDMMLEDLGNVRDLVAGSDEAADADADAGANGAVGDAGTARALAAIDSLGDSMRTFAHTVDVTIGMIDQALTHKDLQNQVELMYLIDSIPTFVSNFATAEGIENFPFELALYLDNSPVAQSSAFKGLYGAGLITSIRGVVDNLLSNSVRYTDPAAGVSVTVHVNVTDKKLHNTLVIQDHCPGGLPDENVATLREALGQGRVTVLRQPSVSSRRASVGSSTTASNSGAKDKPARSTSTGLAHVLELYSTLTSDATDNFDLRISTSDVGSVFTVHFSLDKLVPTEIVSIAHGESEFAAMGGVVCVVDDSAIIRKVIGRALTKLNVLHVIGSDGTEAWDWVREHHDICFGVFSDVEMQGMGGLALASNIYNAFPDIPIVLISGAELGDTLPEGVVDTCVKPLTLPSLQSILRRLHDHNRSANRAMPNQTIAAAAAKSSTLTLAGANA